ncbi:hypothetical protein ASD60_14970 [Pseudomonas sp. Root562]|nr:hypothetical protein ASD60_14970 [Pseudomonas sp. Root562]
MEPKSVQWERFRKVSGFSKEKIGWIAEMAKETRHGGLSFINVEEQEKLLRETWDIVEFYLAV